VRLWVDALDAMHPLEPRVRAQQARQRLEGVDIHQWSEPFEDIEPARIVVEGFGCPLPERYLAAMRARPPVWIDLEYFSAEDWVSGCHGLPSPQGGGLVRHFFFPGLDAGTGGLLRERGLLAARRSFDAGAAHDWRERWKLPHPSPGALNVSLFSYESPALPALIETFAASPTPVTLYVPHGRALTSLAPLFPGQPLLPGLSLVRGALALHVIPFLPQAEYDHLLWSCDLNFVRGEESLTRAIWAGRPFFWQAYPTADGAHLVKLDAFHARWFDDAPAELATLARALWQVWNADSPPSGGFPSLAAYAAQRDWFTRRADRLSTGPELCERLVSFARDRL
jgi:uncharacterized repeat protein (TIGR03837 family)